MAEQRAIAAACREISKALKTREASRDLPDLLAAFKQKVGGVERIAEMMVEDVQRVRGEGLPPEELAVFHHKEQVIQRYHQMFASMMKANDEKVNADLSGIADDDLKATLISLVQDLVKSDSAFRRDVAIEALREDPGLLAELLKQQESVLDVESVPNLEPDMSEPD
mgnify:CR=1 FL=1